MRSGYLVTIRGFIEVNPGNLDDHSKVLAEINEARSCATGAYEVDEKPTTDKMFARMTTEKFDVRPIQRRERGADQGS